jgi:hypothetical protein
MSHILLSHLSRENNTPQLAAELFTVHAKETEVIVASRYEPTAVLKITATKTTAINSIVKMSRPVQLGLF